MEPLEKGRKQKKRFRKYWIIKIRAVGRLVLGVPCRRGESSNQYGDIWLFLEVRPEAIKPANSNYHYQLHV